MKWEAVSNYAWMVCRSQECPQLGHGVLGAPRTWLLLTEIKLYHTGQHGVLGVHGGVATFAYWTCTGNEVLYVGSLTGPIISITVFFTLEKKTKVASRIYTRMRTQVFRNLKTKLSSHSDALLVLGLLCQ